MPDPADADQPLANADNLSLPLPCSVMILKESIKVFMFCLLLLIPKTRNSTAVQL